MLDVNRLKEMERRFEELEHQLCNPEILADPKEYQSLAKTHADLAPVVAKWREYKTAAKQMEEAKELIAEESDPEMKELAKAEFEEIKEKLPALEHELKIMLLPKDPADDKIVMV